MLFVSAAVIVALFSQTHEEAGHAPNDADYISMQIKLEISREKTLLLFGGLIEISQSQKIIKTICSRLTTISGKKE